MIFFTYQGIPESAEVAVPLPINQAQAGASPAAPFSGVPNSSPLNMFPQVNVKLHHVILILSLMLLIFLKIILLHYHEKVGCLGMLMLLFMHLLFSEVEFQETLSDAGGAGLGSLDFLRNNQQVWLLFYLSIPNCFLTSFEV